jgi:hypothetical protein
MAEVLPHAAVWLDRFSNLRNQLQQIFIDLGFKPKKAPIVKQKPVKKEEIVSQEKSPIQKFLPVPEEKTGPALSDLENKIMILLKRFKVKESFGKTSRKSKTSIGKVADDLKIGLKPELDSIFDILAQKGLVENITDSYITFTSKFVEFFEGGDQAFEQYCLNLLQS